MFLRLGDFKLFLREAVLPSVTQSSVVFYHGSSRPHAVGEILEADYRLTEFSHLQDHVGTNLEKFVDQFKPSSAPSRLQCIFLVDTKKDLNLAGASEDYVYTCKPVGIFHRAHFGWFSRLIGFVIDGGTLGDVESTRLAKGYWSGKDYKRTISDSLTAREYLASAVEWITLIGGKKAHSAPVWAGGKFGKTSS